ncbi:T9SS C-terminal target domain-containing protein [candidate division KSB1 bacterium]|nr:T9SS type A sorting domain-containing protein [candidate division KSB1 bacterium]RQW04423.1 MAG: T9SS C-terminal target domain-containing protein [candidate division KSB1 bacterium]
MKYLILTLFFIRLLFADHIIVYTFREFENALNIAQPGDSVLVNDGVYKIQDTWALQVRINHLTIKSLSGIRDNVVIQGRGMHADSHHGFWVDADFVTIQDLTIQNVRNHCIQTHVDADFLSVKNCVLRDAGEQMLKVPMDENIDSPSESGLVEDCLFEYSQGIGPRDYIGGIDCHFAKDWIVRRNVFRDISSPEHAVAEHAVHFWSWSENTLCENNLIINCDRGIGYGLSNSGHRNGTIRNNIIFHDQSPGGGYADVSIEVFNSDRTAIYNNTIYQAHSNYFAGIKNWGGKNVSILNNVVIISDGFYGHVQQAIWVTNGGTGPVSYNHVCVPNPDLFASVDVPDVNRVQDVTDFLHIRDAGVTELIDAGTNDLPGAPAAFIDFDGTIRPVGAAVDIGADEFEECVGIGETTINVPLDYQLFQNYPNPFNAKTLLTFQVPIDGIVNVIIYNAQGYKVAILEQEFYAAGKHSMMWNATPFPSGCYFVTLSTTEYTQSVKALLVK